MCIHVLMLLSDIEGGEIITIGSDAHIPKNIATDFKEILIECGFRYYTIFEHRKPRFEKL